MPLASKPGVPRISETYEECKKIRDAGGVPCLHKETRVGFGLAAGGYGAYEYCVDCGTILDAWETMD